MSGLAALTLARLSPDVAPQRVDILARRLADTAAGLRSVLLVGALLDAAFPGGRCRDKWDRPDRSGPAHGGQCTGNW